MKYEIDNDNLEKYIQNITYLFQNKTEYSIQYKIGTDLIYICDFFFLLRKSINSIFTDIIDKLDFLSVGYWSDLPSG